MSGPRPSESRCFNENSPRPPVPGEERGGFQSRCQQSRSSPDALQHHHQQYHHHHQQQQQQQQVRRSTTSCDASSNPGGGAPLGFEPEGRSGGSCCGEEQLAMATEKAKAEEASTAAAGAGPSLACLQWSRSLHALLEDPKGLELFEHYLQQEGHSYALSFWFACEGLKEERDPAKLTAIIKVLIRRFFQRPQLALPEEVRKEMTRRFRASVNGLANKRMFDLAQQEVERLMEETTYRNFLHSDVYLQYVRHCQRAEMAGSAADAGVGHAKGREDEDNSGAPAAPDNECSSSPDEPSLSCASSLLPTLHEDNEFQHGHPQQQQQSVQHQHSTAGSETGRASTTTTSATTTTGDFGKGEMRLTKDMLMATQQIRALDVRPKPEAFAGLYLQPGASPYHASVPARPRVQYTSYNPVSRQDSELQSLSSDARTESDNLSLTDASLSDSTSLARRNTRKQHIRQYQAIKKSAMINRDPVGHEAIIPRTQRVSREQTKPPEPEEFARQLIEKLERVKRDRENEEKLKEKLREVDMSNAHNDSLCESQQQLNVCGSGSVGGGSGTVCAGVGGSSLQSRMVADALRQKLQLEEDNDQDILDQHVSRIWSDPTPSRSPKLASPRPRSPDKSSSSASSRRHHLHQQAQAQAQMMSAVAAHQQHQQHLHQQQQQQMGLTGPPGPTARPQVYRSQRKEKDVFSTFSGDSGNVHDFPEAGELHAAGSMSSLGSHHLPKSKSVPSDYADSLHKQDLYLQGQDPRYRRLDAARSSATKKSMTELTDSGVSVVSDVPPAVVKDSRLLNWLKETDGAVASCKPEPAGGGLGISAKPSSSRKKFSNAPQQPFVGDPGMPLLPRPHTPTQLEEASRRLEYEKYEQNRNRQRYPGGGGGGGSSGAGGGPKQPDYELMPAMQQSCLQSSQSTLRKGRQDAAPSEFTTVVFSFCEEKVPYRTKIPGYNVTLKQFKDVLPKKGSYRYFFKTECEDLDMKVIQEEITDDAEILPLWEGKVMAQVKALE